MIRFLYGIVLLLGDAMCALGSHQWSPRVSENGMSYEVCERCMRRLRRQWKDSEIE